MMWRRHHDVWLATAHYPDPNPLGAASVVAALFAGVVLWCLLRGGGRRKGSLAKGPALMLAGTVWVFFIADGGAEGHHIVGLVIFTVIGLAVSLENLREESNGLLANGAAFSALHGAMLTILGVSAVNALWRHISGAWFAWALAAWTIVWLTLVITAARRVGERRRRWNGGKCLACGYDLRASGARCSECGTPVY